MVSRKVLHISLVATVATVSVQKLTISTDYSFFFVTVINTAAQKSTPKLNLCWVSSFFTFIWNHHLSLSHWWTVRAIQRKVFLLVFSPIIITFFKSNFQAVANWPSMKNLFGFCTSFWSMRTVFPSNDQMGIPYTALPIIYCSTHTE